MTTTHQVAAPDGSTLPVRIVQTPRASTMLVLAHGAGTSMDHPSLVALQHRLAERGTTVVTFDFPYRARGRGMPDRLPVLVDAYAAVLAAIRLESPARLFIGGRSMGGRVASHVAAAGTPVAGLVFLGFPLHPPGKPGTTRAAHLGSIRAPMLFVQGTRDAFARRDLLMDVLRDLPAATLHEVPDADHGFHVPKRTGKTDDDVQREIADVITRWITER